MALKVAARQAVQTPQGTQAHGIVIEDDQGNIRVTLVYNTQSDADWAGELLGIIMTRATLAS